MVQTLKSIIGVYGLDILKDGNKLLAYYSDLAPMQKRERQMLEYLVKCDGHITLMNALYDTTDEQTRKMKQLVDRMVAQVLVSEDIAETVCKNFWESIGGMPIALKQPKQTPTSYSGSSSGQNSNTQPTGGRNTVTANINKIQGNTKPVNGKQVLPKHVLVGIAAAVILVVGFAFVLGSKQSNNHMSNANSVNDQTQISNNQMEISDDTNEFIQETEYTGPMDLFEMPVVCERNVTSGTVNHLYFSEEETDVAGYRHQNCYKLCGSEYEEYIGYDLGGKYKALSGTLYAYNEGEFCAGWLDFYDGESLLFSTEKVSAEAPSTDFCLDVSGVDNLIVHFRATDAGTWMIVENLIVSRESVTGSVSKAPVELFNLPIYSEDDFYLAFDTKVDDAAGNVYINTYLVCASPYDNYVRYDLNGEYDTLSGTVHTGNGYGDAWFDFYDGDTLLFSTEKVGPDQNSAAFNIDVSGVKYLTMYSRSEQSGEWVVVEDFLLTK